MTDMTDVTPKDLLLHVSFFNQVNRLAQYIQKGKLPLGIALEKEEGIEAFQTCVNQQYQALCCKNISLRYKQHQLGILCRYDAQRIYPLECMIYSSGYDTHSQLVTVFDHEDNISSNFINHLTNLDR